MTIIRFIFALILLSACSSPSIESDVLDDDVEELLLDVVLQFDEVMMEHTGASSPELAYLQFSEGLLNCSTSIEMGERIDVIQPAVLEILEGLDHHPSFYQIWGFDYRFDFDNEVDTIGTLLTIDEAGVYFDYLQQNESKNAFIDGYVKTLSAAHAITPSMFSSLPYSMEEFDLQRIEDRMFIAVHYVTFLSFRDKDDWRPEP